MYLGLIIGTALLANPAPTPQIVQIETSPARADSNGTVLLPNGSGTLHIEVKVKNTNQVRFWITHMELNAWEERQLLREDRDGSDGWTADFPYQKDEGFSYQIIVDPEGAKEEDRRSIYVHHSIGLEQ